jgi:glutathione peroxidase
MNTSISQKQSFYDFEAESINGKTTSMQSFKGKTIIVVNTASKCGLTPQYAGLEALYKKYKDQGLVVLGFPCNQFAEQEAGNNAEIQEFCQVNFGVSFPMFNKIDVNGANTHPIFAFLKSQLPDFLGKKVKWNFTKFVVDKNGKPVKRFLPFTKPEKMEAYIKRIL